MMQKLTGLSLAFSALLLLPACADEAASASTQSVSRAEVEDIVRDYILENPEIIEEALLILDARQKAEEDRLARAAIADNHDALYNHASDYSIGPDDAEVTVVEFFDYRCGYCKRSVDYVAALPANYEGKVRVVFKDLPILSPESRVAARAAIAAGLQGKYFEMHVALMESRGNFTNAEINMIAQSVGVDVEQMREDMETDAVNDHLAESLDLARRLGVSGTPAFYVGDTKVPGANTPAVTRLIEEQLD